MGVIDIIRSVLGIGGESDQPRRRRTDERDSAGTPTDERAGGAATGERAADESAVDESAAAETSASASTGSMTEEPPESPGSSDVAEATEPAEAAGPNSQAETTVSDDGAAADTETADADAAAEPGEQATGTGDDASVDSVSGIGAAYAERLAEAGVETVDDLAEADATAVAEETGISEKRVTRWQERAEE